ncbi:hypothetical protein BDV19DRAFT_380800 [Aspergillus venezuelensis]
MEMSLTPSDYTLREPNTGPDEWSAQVDEIAAEPGSVTQDTSTAEHSYDWRAVDVALMSEMPSEPITTKIEGCVFDKDKELIGFSPGQSLTPDSYKPTLTALAHKTSDASKDFLGTQWRNAQFCWARGNDPQGKKALPAKWPTSRTMSTAQCSSVIPSATQSVCRIFPACHTPRSLFSTSPARTLSAISSTP